MNTKDEDRAIAKAARAAAARTTLDIGELQVNCFNSTVELTGKVRGPRGAAGTINVRKEFKALINLIGNVRGVRDVQSARVIIFD